MMKFTNENGLYKRKMLGTYFIGSLILLSPVIILIHGDFRIIEEFWIWQIVGTLFVAISSLFTVKSIQFEDSSFTINYLWHKKRYTNIKMISFPGVNVKLRKILTGAGAGAVEKKIVITNTDNQNFEIDCMNFPTEIIEEFKKLNAKL